MSYNLIWIFLLILQTFVAPFPLPNQYDLGVIGIDQEHMNRSPKIPKNEHSHDSSDEKVISVRITSSVAVGRGNGKVYHRNPAPIIDRNPLSKVSHPEPQSTTTITINEEIVQTGVTEVPQNLIGANIEYIKQLNAKKESREHSADHVHPFELMVKDQHDTNCDSLQKKSPIAVDEYDEDIKDIPLGRKVPSMAEANQFQDHKASRRYQNLDMNPPVEYYEQNHNVNATNDSLFEPSMKFGSKINSNDNTNVRNITTAQMFDQRSDKKGIRGIDHLTRIGTFVSNSHNYDSDDSVAESSIKSVDFAKYNEEIENISPKVTMPSAHSPNNVQGLTNKPRNEERNNPRLTTVSFNIVHDSPKATNDNESSNSYITSSQIVPNQQGFYDPPKIYSEPAKIYSEPAKFYSEPAKIYSEPAKIYSEPAKVYSEPAKIYSEPSKFYSEPASLHLDQNVRSSIAPNYTPWQRQPQRPFGSATMNTTPLSTDEFQGKNTEMEHQPEKNYEVDEKVSVLTDGRSHGVQQETSTEKCKQENCKVGYVVEGRQFKKYRVEERTPDGFIVGEYGVVRNEDGALRGVRYTADSDASPRLIHDALMKFLQLK